MNKIIEAPQPEETEVTMRGEKSDEAAEITEHGPPKRKNTGIVARVAAAIKKIINPSG